MRIAHEFRTVTILATLVLITLQISSSTVLWLGWVLWGVFVLLLRDFRRVIPAQPLAIVAVVDGHITAVKPALDPFLQRPSLVCSIAQSSFGEFNIHSPIEGKIEQLWLRDPVNLRHIIAVWIRSDEADDVVFTFDLHALHHRAIVSMQPGERIGQGQRCGFAAMGCEVKLYIPENAQATVKPGDKVKAGRAMLAKLKHG